jgi:hypothetical protein
MSGTLGSLKQKIDRMIQIKGEDFPASVFIFTKDDVNRAEEDLNEFITMEEMDQENVNSFPIPPNGPLSDDDIDNILTEIEDNSYIYEVISNCIKDEVKDIMKNRIKRE